MESPTLCKRLIPANDWSKFHAWPPLGGLRHLIFHANSNGFDAVVKRVGRRVLIDEDAFFNWVNTPYQTQGTSGAEGRSRKVLRSEVRK